MDNSQELTTQPGQDSRVEQSHRIFKLEPVKSHEACQACSIWSTAMAAWPERKPHILNVPKGMLVWPRPMTPSYHGWKPRSKTA